MSRSLGQPGGIVGRIVLLGGLCLILSWCLAVDQAGGDEPPARHAASATEAAVDQPGPNADTRSARALTADDLGRSDDYHRALVKARAWFDQLEVDPVELLQHGIKGKKKLSEIISVYKMYLNHCHDPADRGRIMDRLKEFVRQANRPEYHDIAELYELEQKSNKRNNDRLRLIQNSMSYFRVAFLLEGIGFDMSAYRRELLQVKPMLDEHMKRRGPWQRAMFADYYDHFGLEKPPILQSAKMKQGVVKQRLPLEKYNRDQCYALTHEVFVAYMYGQQRQTDRFTDQDRAYMRELLPALIRQYVQARDPDLTAELVSCMTYLGYHADVAFRAGVNYLLDSQNANGSWGNYEHARPAYGEYLDVHAYLHTTLVAVHSLLEMYEGGWATAVEETL